MKMTEVNMPKFPPWFAWALLALSLLGLRAFIIFESPPMYWWDAFTRLWEADQFRIRHWLPIPQLPIWLMGDSIVPLRLVYAAVGSLGAVAMGLAASRIWTRPVGLLAGWLIGTVSVFIHWTVVPYQEGFLVLSLGGVLYFWHDGMENAEGANRWLGAGAMALGCLCRFEMWLVGLLFVSLCVSARKPRALRLALPALLLVAGWLVIVQLTSSNEGPPRYGAAKNVGGVFDSLTTNGFGFLKDMVGDAIAEVTVVASILSLGGVAVSFRSGAVKRMLVMLTLCILALTLLRIASAQFLSSRMIVLVVVLLLVFSSVGWTTLMERLPTGVARIIGVVAPIFLVLFFADRGRARVLKSARLNGPEARAAELLATLPPEQSVLIFPRRRENVYRESAIGGIFANRPDLDRHSTRWMFEGKWLRPETRLPSLTLRYKDGEYELAPIPADMREDIRRKQKSIGGLAPDLPIP